MKDVISKLLMALDEFFAGAIWGLYGITVSARCDMALASTETGWHMAGMRVIGRGLNWLQANHTRDARANDLLRLQKSETYLNSEPKR